MALSNYHDPSTMPDANVPVPPVPASGNDSSSHQPIRRVDPPSQPVRYHRLSEVRQAQGVSLRNMARRLDVDVATVHAQEDPTQDLNLSTLFAWQKILEVPITELLDESNDPLSAPVLQRAQLVRLMKTVKAILEQSEEINIKRMAQMLSEQLIQIMPELDEVTPWPSIGQYRDAKDYGQAAYRRFPDHINRRLED